MSNPSRTNAQMRSLVEPETNDRLAFEQRVSDHDPRAQLRQNAAFMAQMKVQRRHCMEEDTQATLAAAAQGVQGSGGALPYLETIQKSFGHHDVTSVQAFVGGQAKTASEAIGAEAYASGNAVAFRDSPTLHTAAHEAAHIVQQRYGVQLKGGVGQVGDKYEVHADAVADRVVQGKDASDLLDTFVGQGRAGAGVQRRAVQRLSDPEVDVQFEAPSYLSKPSLKRHAQICSMLKGSKRLGPVIVVAAAILAATSSPQDLFVTQGAGAAAGGGSPLSSEAQAIRSIPRVVKARLRSLVGDMTTNSSLPPRDVAYWEQVWNRFGL